MHTFYGIHCTKINDTSFPNPCGKMREIRDVGAQARRTNCNILSAAESGPRNECVCVCVGGGKGRWGGETEEKVARGRGKGTSGVSIHGLWSAKSTELQDSLGGKPSVNERSLSH